MSFLPLYAACWVFWLAHKHQNHLLLLFNFMLRESSSRGCLIFFLPLLFGVHLCLSVPVSGVCLIFPLSLFFGTLHSLFPAFLSYWLSALVVRSCFWFLLNRQFQCSVQDSSSLFSNLAVCIVSNIGNKL